MYETLLSDYIKVEPYWNVNLKLPLLLNLYGCIKVEPYWNVNIWVKLLSLKKFLN